MVMTGDIRLPSGKSLYGTSPVTIDTFSRWRSNIVLQPQLRAVVFDIGMVFANFYFRGASQTICAREGWQGESRIRQVEDCLTDPALKGDLERGRTDMRAFYEGVRSSLSLQNTGLWHFTRIWNNIFTYRNDTEDMAERMRASGIKSLLLSDTNKQNYDHIRKRSSAVRNADAAFLSFQTGLYKSDGPGVYEILISAMKDKYGIDPGAAIYFDDRADYVAQAVSLGLPAMQFFTARDSETAVKEIWGTEF